ncbi:MAG TPA: rRNA adenine N-6-methyltransferase family protein [Tepidisphaeraceae bacterium]|nr:rRNA adenine N-6-methyltransferase family protein [Tepidisphaeraceae bacterium]
MIFLKKFLKHGTRVASIAPSSPQMARELCRYVDSNSPQIILELGAGTGAVTKQIVKQMHARSQLLAVEIDHDFADRLRKVISSENVEILVEDVTHLHETLSKKGIDKVDLIISGLPMPSLPKETVAAVQKLMQTHGRSAWYSQLTEFPFAMYRKFYKRLFAHVEYRIVPVNIPPGGTYHCRI